MVLSRLNWVAQVRLQSLTAWQKDFSYISWLNPVNVAFRADFDSSMGSA